GAPEKTARPHHNRPAIETPGAQRESDPLNRTYLRDRKLRYRSFMAITDIPEFAHLSEADIEALGAELEQIRQDIIGSLGERDADYIRNTIRFQRGLEVGARVLLMLGSRNKTAWAIGAGALGVAKIVENMALGL